MELTIKRLKLIETQVGTYERQLYEEVNFEGDFPKLVREEKQIVCRKLSGSLAHRTRSQTQEAAEFDIRGRATLSQWVQQFKYRACRQLADEIEICMSQD